MRLSLTGRPSLTTEDGRAVRLPRKAFVLAAHLLLDPPKGALPRERAARFLWEDVDPSRRAGNLRQLLARVKDVQTEFGFTLFVIGPEHVGLDTDVATIDVAMVLRARADTTDRRLVELCRAYSGDLLFGLDEGGEEFTHWLWNRRAVLREQFVAIVAANLEASIGVIEPDEVVLVARRLMDADQYQEAAHRALMRIHATRGEFETAFRIHRRLVDLLRESNGRPSAETTTLHQELVARARPAAGTAAETEAVGDDMSRGQTATVPGVARALRLPRLALVFPGLAALAGVEREWAEALFDDSAIQLWRTRALVVSRPVDIRPRPIDLLDRPRREPSDYSLEFRAAVRDGRRLVTIGLICAATGEIMWIQRFDLGEALATVVRELVVNCVHQIEQAELRALAEGPERTTAYRLMLQGNRLLRSVDLPSVRRARQVFRAALSADPDYAPTLAAISKAYRLEWLLLARADDKELDLAIDFARQAIAVGPDGVHGFQQLGICNIYDKNYEYGLRALERAEKHFPFQMDVVADHADGLICAGLLREGIEKIKPIHDDNIIVSDHILWNAASGHYLSGYYEEAIALLSRMTTEEPAYHLKAASYAMLSQLDEARRYARKLREILPDFTIAKRLEMVPLRRREDLEHYAVGLRAAGFE